MDSILFIDACVRPESRTKRLAGHLLSRLTGDITTVDLEKEAILPLTDKTLQARAAHVECGDIGQPELRYARQFACADTVVIAAPYWNLSFPASLNAYFEAVNVGEIAFHYSEDGEPRSLCRARKLYYVTSAGGYIYEGDLGYAYVEALAKTFYDIKDCRSFKAEGLDLAGADVEAILRRAEAEIDAALID